MKANELRIGNYVFSGVGGNVRVDEIRLVVGVGYVVRMYLRNGEDHESWLNLMVSDAKPIPLTPELLEKCGFSKESEYVYRHDEFGDHVLYDAPTDWGDTSEYPTEIDGHGGGVLYGYCHGSAVIRTLYLHDLQNKFFAITGQELGIKLLQHGTDSINISIHRWVCGIHGNAFVYNIRDCGISYTYG